jgi:hypothetical protein
MQKNAGSKPPAFFISTPVGNTKTYFTFQFVPSLESSSSIPCSQCAVGAGGGAAYTSRTRSCCVARQKPVGCSSMRANSFGV